MLLRSVVALLVLAAPQVAHAQLLQRASGAARGSNDDSGGYSDNDRDDDDDDGGSLLSRASSSARDYDDGYDDEYDWGGGSSGGVSTPGSATPYRISTAPSEHLALGGCPYGASTSGFGVTTTNGSDWGDVSVRLSLEGGYAIEGAGRAGASVRVQLPWIIDLTTRYSLFVEPVPGGVVALALGRTGLDLRIVQLPELQLRLGAAVRHMQDGQGALGGGDASFGLDLFPGSPVVLSIEASVGVVGEAVVVQARGQVGLIFGAIEVYAGYHYEGLFNGGHVDLGGPMAGVRAWL